MENIAKRPKIEHKKSIVASLTSQPSKDGKVPPGDSVIDPLLTTSIITITHNR